MKAHSATTNTHHLNVPLFSRQSNSVFRFMGAMIIEVTVLLFTVVMTMIDTSQCELNHP